LIEEDDSGSREVGTSEDGTKKNMKGDPAPNPLFKYGSSLHAKKEEKEPKLGQRKIAKLGSEPDSSAKLVGNKTPEGKDILHVQLIPADVSADTTHNIYVDDSNEGSLELRPHEPSPPVVDRTDDATDPDDTWISCLARQSRRLSVVSRWLLTLGMILCIISMMWICVTVIRTAPRRRLFYQAAQQQHQNVMIIPVAATDLKKGPAPVFHDTEKLSDGDCSLLNLSGGSLGCGDEELLLVPPPPPSEDGEAPPPYVHTVVGGGNGAAQQKESSKTENA
jgi:hypothetical protein